jgi:hypothetical protein
MQVIEPAQIHQPCRLQGIGITLAILAKVRNVPLQRSAAVVVFIYFPIEPLNHHVERVFDPSRKATHWGRRKGDQSFFDFAASLANRSAFNRSRFLRSAICSFSYSVRGLSDGRNVLLASFSRLLMT